MKRYKSFNTKEKIIYIILSIVGAGIGLCLANFAGNLIVPSEKNFIFDLCGWLLVTPFTFIPLIKNIYGFIVFLLVFILCLFMIVIFILIFSFPFISLFYGIINMRIKRIKEDSTFLSNYDMDYYRELLENIRPHELSLITNLKMEKEKDIAANILYLKNRNIIKEIDGKIIFSDELSNLDSHFKDTLFNNGYKKWEKECIKDAINNGYLEYKIKPKKIFKRILLLGLIFVLSFAFLSPSLSTMDQNDSFPFTAEEEAFMDTMSDEEINNPIILMISFKLIIVGTLLISTVLLFFILPGYLIITSLILSIRKKKLIRTEKGNELADKVLGLKNFIQNFTTLDERQAKEFALWNDYLVYAVVLEENQQIIDELQKIYNF